MTKDKNAITKIRTLTLLNKSRITDIQQYHKFCPPNQNLLLDESSFLFHLYKDSKDKEVTNF